MIHINPIIDVIISPRSFFSRIKKLNTNQTLIYSLIISLLIFLFYMLRVFYEFSNKILPMDLAHYNILFIEFDLFKLFYFLAFFVLSFIIFLTISLMMSLLCYFILILMKRTIEFSLLWKIIVFSMTPLIFDQLVDLLISISRKEIYYTSYFFYGYITILVYMGIYYSKQKTLILHPK